MKAHISVQNGKYRLLSHSKNKLFRNEYILTWRSIDDSSPERVILDRDLGTVTYGIVVETDLVCGQHLSYCP